jgi:ribosomal protein S18 acetylase RimI-like enzyme
MDAHDLLRPDPWLSKELTRAVFSLTWPEAAPPSAADLAQALDGLGAGPLMVQAKLPADDLAGVRLLEGLGFGLVETSLIFERPVSPGLDKVSRAKVRPARPADQDAVAAMARQAFVHSRLLRDPILGPELGGRVKEAWARNFFSGARGEVMLVAMGGADLVGFVLLLTQERAVVVDLIAVAPMARGQGVAGDLLKTAQDWGRGMETIRAGTQLTNAASLALYQGQGFALTNGHLVYHYHR